MERGTGEQTGSDGRKYAPLPRYTTKYRGSMRKRGGDRGRSTFADPTFASKSWEANTSRSSREVVLRSGPAEQQSTPQPPSASPQSSSVARVGTVVYRCRCSTEEREDNDDAAMDAYSGGERRLFGDDEGEDVRCGIHLATAQHYKQYPQVDELQRSVEAPDGRLAYGDRVLPPFVGNATTTRALVPLLISEAIDGGSTVVVADGPPGSGKSETLFSLRGGLAAAYAMRLYNELATMDVAGLYVVQVHVTWYPAAGPKAPMGEAGRSEVFTAHREGEVDAAMSAALQLPCFTTGTNHVIVAVVARPHSEAARRLLQPVGAVHFIELANGSSGITDVGELGTVRTGCGAFMHLLALGLDFARHTTGNDYLSHRDHPLCQALYPIVAASRAVIALLHVDLAAMNTHSFHSTLDAGDRLMAALHPHTNGQCPVDLLESAQQLYAANQALRAEATKQVANLNDRLKAVEDENFLLRAAYSGAQATRRPGEGQQRAHPPNSANVVPGAENTTTDATRQLTQLTSVLVANGVVQSLDPKEAMMQLVGQVCDREKVLRSSNKANDLVGRGLQPEAWYTALTDAACIWAGDELLGGQSTTGAEAFWCDSRALRGQPNWVKLAMDKSQQDFCARWDASRSPPPATPGLTPTVELTPMPASEMHRRQGSSVSDTMPLPSMPPLPTTRPVESKGSSAADLRRQASSNADLRKADSGVVSKKLAALLADEDL